MQSDPDIRAERMANIADSLSINSHVSARYSREDSNDSIPLNVYSSKHHASSETSALLVKMGGLEVLREFTNKFYEKVFADPHLSKFIRDQNEPHGERFATWIAEKFGIGTPWSEERQRRPQCPFHSHGRVFQTPHDRSSAHYAAWHSPHRESSKFGRHFKLDDCRVWMRLHFWAARETGLFDDAPEFMNYYVRFIGHFVSVYERTAPTFARESARWSANLENIERYIANGNRMDDVIDLLTNSAYAQLPQHEREYSGSSVAAPSWPYELGA